MEKVELNSHDRESLDLPGYRLERLELLNWGTFHGDRQVFAPHGGWSLLVGDLICVCAFFDANPRPNCFPRQLPIPVGTRFIEERAGILAELLTLVLGDRVNTEGLSFEERFHLRLEPAQVRFRFLDGSVREQTRWPVMDCTISVHDLACLSWRIPRVLVVENKAVFLCLPNVPNTLAILGSGKAAALLPSCSWLQESDVVYWGRL